MRHEEIQDLLEDYVDDRLDRPTRKLVDDHLEECAECRRILDEVAPVDISRLGPGVFDERAMRRTVRRSLFRTAWNTVLLVVVGWMAIWFLAALLFQPLVVNRDGRAADIVRASIDLGIMLNPGAVLTDGSVSSGLLGRRVDLEFGVPVGAAEQPAVFTSTSIGPLGIGDVVQDQSHTPTVDYGHFQGEAVEQLSLLGESTVATVALWFDTPISLAAAQALADDPALEFRVVWAGFDASLGRSEFPSWTAGGMVGYPTCQLPLDDLDDEMLGATSAGFSRGSGFLFGDASIDTALESVVAALTNIADRDELVDYLVEPFGDDRDSVREILTELQTDPEVSMVVVTGPSSAIAEHLESEPGVFGNVLAVDFYNWTDGICGR